MSKRRAQSLDAGQAALVRIGRCARLGHGAALLAGCTLLAACGMFGSRTDKAAAPARGPGLEAGLRPLASGVSGKARVVDRGDGITLLLSMINLPIGEYRVAFGERANCSSPNGFSAGAPWAPASAGKDARVLVPALTANRDGTAEASIYLRGVHATGPDGVAGHSIVIYTGNEVTDARPDVPNNRIACGVFAPTVPFAF
jgi:Cu/Zn superoxide dismutase